MNLASIITQKAKETPTKLALENEGVRITYEQLEQTINQTTHLFRQRGVIEGDRILLQLGNCLEFVYCYFAAVKCGAIIVPINPTYTAAEITHIAFDSQPVLFVVDATASENFQAVRENSDNFIDVILVDTQSSDNALLRAIQSLPTHCDPGVVDDERVCQILYTSGTTGKPKGAMLTHKGLRTNAMTYKDILHCSSDDYCLISSPLYHAASQTNCMLTMLVAGGTSYILPKYSTDKVLTLLEDKKVTFYFIPPSVVAMLLNHPRINERTLYLRIAFTGSAPMPVELLDRWKAVSGVELIEGYGLTECSPIVTSHRPEGKKKPGSIGTALPRVSVVIRDNEGKEIPSYEKGELTVKGPNVMKGYWKNDVATANTIRGGWLYTGDIAYQDDEGYLYIVDRKKDLVIRGGMNIYPREIEEVLYTHPDVLEASVIGSPDPIMGEVVHAYFSTKDSSVTLTTDMLQRHCRPMLAPYKIPAYFTQLDELPKQRVGKF
ncbi:class I adenylate-forming enzyme family protein [Geomicrobium sp. JCM 19055]|uniref:class I adenylate-forming enzyme family protein n=1 Tax=Geomicrobium sp. JCM 19055 TaxID=1460649 RepID=UPI00045ED800|nr:AMP-binding protein [Geomicrobium sp. JCM 19055]GAK00702.1 long-chain-fatty-acid-CoA ligase [Geomicrobium sp. JCM 19055]